MNAQPKSIAQLKAIFGLSRRAGHDDTERHAVIAEVTQGRTSSARDLTFDEGNRVIEHYGGRPFKPVSRRTTLHHRQHANVQQVAQPAHLDLMHALATRRGMSEQGLRELSTRIVKHFPPRTTSETNKVIEALKAMNRRTFCRVA